MVICYTTVRKYTPSLISLSFARDLFQPLPRSLHAPPLHAMAEQDGLEIREHEKLGYEFHYLPPPITSKLIHISSHPPFFSPPLDKSFCHWTQSSQVTPGPCYTLSSLSSQLLPLYLLLSLSIKLSSLS